MWHDSEEYHEEYEAQYGYGNQVDYSGNPSQDIDYDRSFVQKNYILPEIIKNFLCYFQKCIQDHDVYEIQNAYENGFNKLTEKFFFNNPWPEADEVARNIHCDGIFLILYKELYYRHVYAKCNPTFSQRIESFQNYCQLFNYIINAQNPVNLALPHQWLWDIIDEFIYQYQSFSQNCCKISKKREEDMEMLRNNASLWNVHHILNVLHSLVEKSNINILLEDDSKDPGPFGNHTLYKFLGYLSLIGLLRLHTLHGDYHLALKVIEKINFNSEDPTFMLVPSCHITAYYYVGFAYMMMKRYQDAIRTFTNALLFIHKTKQLLLSKTYLYDQINKQNDQIFTLLGMSLALHPMSIDDLISSQLREKLADRFVKMQKGDKAEFEISFQFACPKFLHASPPSWDMPLTPHTHKEPHLQQWNVFSAEVANLGCISVIRSYLKLYTTMPISKLANFMGIPESKLISHLMLFKLQMHSRVWTKGSSCLDGEFQSNSELDFYIDKDMIHIADTKVERKYGEFFIMHIHKFEELNAQLSKNATSSNGR